MVISFLIGRNISRPVVEVSRAMREMAVGNVDVQLPGLERRDEVGQMARAVKEFKVQAVAKAERYTAEREGKNRELAVAAAPNCISWPRVSRPRSAASLKTSAPHRANWRIPPSS